MLKELKITLTKASCQNPVNIFRISFQQQAPVSRTLAIASADFIPASYLWAMWP